MPRRGELIRGIPPAAGSRTAGAKDEGDDLAQSELRHLAHDEGKTVVIVTHDPALADDADDRLDLGGRNLNEAASHNAALTGAE